MPPNKPLVSVSPSQTKTAHTCPTKWWAEKRLGLRSPSTPATRFGNILHAVVECYLLQIPEDKQFAYIVETTTKDTGANEPVTKQEVGRAWGLVNHNIKLGLLPAPGEGRVEGTVKYAIDGVPTSMNARFDWLGVTTHPVTGRLCPLVVDHKTTSSPNFAETEETLVDNDQAIIYGEYGLRQMPEADYVCVRFVYYQTKDRKHGWIVEIWLTRNEVERKYRDMVKYIAQMCAWYEEDDINKIPREVSNNTCRAYNRDCAAIGVCPAHVSNKDTSPASAASAWVQSARNASVKPTTPKKESSNMSVAVINEAKYAPTFRAIITKKFADQLGINEDQAQVMLAEFESKSGWTQDPEVQAARLPVEAAKAGARIIQKRAATKARRQQAEDALAAVGLPDTGRRGLQELSHGQFQRVLFARLLLQDAPLMVLDEPFAAVDAATTADLLALVGRWHAQARTVICVLHDLDCVREHFPQTLLLARQPLGWGPTSQVLTPELLQRAQGLGAGWRQGSAGSPALGTAA